MTLIKAGTWVEIQETVLEPEFRAPTLPEETKGVPYVMRVSGFLTADANLGDHVTIKTLIGRELQGKLTVVEPSYGHSFGKVVPEILRIGLQDGEA